MVLWNDAQLGIIQAVKENRLASLNLAKRYKCHVCYHVRYEDEVEQSPTGKLLCIVCKSPVFEMCPLDHTHCSHSIESGLAYCPICGVAVCPSCGSHDVEQVSRVTGYLASVNGWNNAKAQELKDRVRSNVVNSEPVLVSALKGSYYPLG
jgi:hypothetical protein